MNSLLKLDDRHDPVANIQQWQLRQSNVQVEAVGHSEISILCQSLIDLFRETLIALGKDNRASKTIQVDLDRSRSAFSLWSDGYGIAQGHFDNTFDKSAKLRRVVTKTLSHIGEALTERLIPRTAIWSDKLQELCLRVRSALEDANRVIEGNVKEESDNESSSGASSHASFGDDLTEIAEDLRIDTRCLVGLGPLLKNPVFDPEGQEVSTELSAFIWSPSRPYADKIQSRFPQADLNLIHHLGNANYERYLRCQAARDSLNHERQLELVATDIEPHIAPTLVSGSNFHDSGIGTSVAPTISYAETIMSYIHEGRSVRIPFLPQEAKTGKPFDCLACGRKVVIKNSSLWKRHIFSDLQPYICLDMDCSYSKATFASREKWASHLALDHGMDPKWEAIQCFLCAQDTGKGKMAIIKHLSQHLEEISLSALPAGVDSNTTSENGSEIGDEDSTGSASVLSGTNLTRAPRFLSEDPPGKFACDVCDLRFHLREHLNRHTKSQHQKAEESNSVPPLSLADTHPPCNTLHVGNLPSNASEEELQRLLREQPGYKRHVFRTKAGNPMCFVEFEHVSFATRALNELYGYVLQNSKKGQGIRLSFTKDPLRVGAEQTSTHDFEDRPFRCHVCGKMFSQSDLLTAHARTHEFGFPFFNPGPTDQSMLGTKPDKEQQGAEPMASKEPTEAVTDPEGPQHSDASVDEDEIGVSGELPRLQGDKTFINGRIVRDSGYEEPAWGQYVSDDNLSERLSGIDEDVEPHEEATDSSQTGPTKIVVFKLALDEPGQFTLREPLAAKIYPHDTIESIISTVKQGFYGIYGQRTVGDLSFVDDQGNPVVAEYENFRDGMDIYVRPKPTVEPSPGKVEGSLRDLIRGKITEFTETPVESNPNARGLSWDYYNDPSLPAFDSIPVPVESSPRPRGLAWDYYNDPDSSAGSPDPPNHSNLSGPETGRSASLDVVNLSKTDEGDRDEAKQLVKIDHSTAVLQRPSNGDPES
ncbi:hypothetical protein QBC44DRAFT_121497 [Cladorrhinum sp. PSN332]|nr:hypothetical protein QBC44DRAFT_121497 [Cladorrhinum sp. PSN332]